MSLLSISQGILVKTSIGSAILYRSDLISIARKILIVPNYQFLFHFRKSRLQKNEKSRQRIEIEKPQLPVKFVENYLAQNLLSATTFFSTVNQNLSLAKSVTNPLCARIDWSTTWRFMTIIELFHVKSVIKHLFKHVIWNDMKKYTKTSYPCRLLAIFVDNYFHWKMILLYTWWSTKERSRLPVKNVAKMT